MTDVLIKILGSMRPTHYDALAEFLQYNCFALQELNLLGIWINGYKLCESMKKLRQIRHLSIPFIADGALMEVVSRNCSQLKTIDLSGSTSLREEDILKLSNLRATLRYICGMFNIDKSQKTLIFF